MRLANFSVLSSAEVESIHRATLQILGQTGVLIEDRRLLALLADAGAEVDFSHSLCRIPENLVMGALEGAPRRIPLYDRNGKQVALLGESETHPFAGHAMPFYLDAETGPRPATKADVESLTRLVDALPELHLACVPASPQDVPAASAFAHAAEAVLANSVKPLFVAPDRAPVAEAIITLARLATGVDDISSHPVLVFQLSVESPLRVPPSVCDLLYTVASAGVPVVIHAGPMSGASAPLTLAGFMATHNAEVLTGVVITQVIRRGTPVIYGGGWGAMDLRVGSRIVASPESALLRIAAGQLTQFYGLPRHTIGIHADGPAQDEQTGWEKMLTALATIMSGFDLMSNSGALGVGMLVNHEQIVIDHEILGIAKRMARGFTADTGTLALDAVARVGPGGSFLMDEHTLAHLRTGEFWEPRLSYRGSVSAWFDSGKTNVVASARAQTEQILRSHWPPPLPGHIRSEMARVVSRLGEETS
jgi:trimethylamine---corrinoid protein Co-methyltransferase